MLKFEFGYLSPFQIKTSLGNTVCYCGLITTFMSCHNCSWQVRRQSANASHNKLRDSTIVLKSSIHTHLLHIAQAHQVVCFTHEKIIQSISLHCEGFLLNADLAHTHNPPPFQVHAHVCMCSTRHKCKRCNSYSSTCAISLRYTQNTYTQIPRKKR